MIKSFSSTRPNPLEFLRTAFPDRPRVSTKELADTFGIRPETIHRAHSMEGGYLGMVPIKLPNGRLMWPLD